MIHSQNFMLYRLLLIFILAFASFLHAEIDFDHPMTLSELVDVALENNPSTSKAWWNANRAAAAVGRAKSAYYPQAALEANATNGRYFKFINGPDTSYTIVGADLVVSMLLYDFGERCANVESARMALIAASWQTDWNIQRVMVRVLENAYATLYAQAVVDAAAISCLDAERILNIAKELNRAGLSPISDVYTSQATLSQMRMDLSQQRALLDIQRGKLATSLGMPANICFELAPLAPIQEIQFQKTEELMELASKQRADLMAKQARLSEAVFNKQSAFASFGPKLTLFGSGGYNHAFHDKAHGAQYEVFLNLEIPLFNGFDTVYQNRMAYADTQISDADLAELQLDIYLEVLTYNRSLEAAKEMLPDAEENLTNATKAYESVLERYKAGTERIAEVSNAQRQLAAARVRYSDVQTRWYVSMANLAYATGTLAPYTEIPCTEE